MTMIVTEEFRSTPIPPKEGRAEWLDKHGKPEVVTLTIVGTAVQWESVGARFYESGNLLDDGSEHWRKEAEGVCREAFEEGNLEPQADLSGALDVDGNLGPGCRLGARIVAAAKASLLAKAEEAEKQERLFQVWKEEQKKALAELDRGRLIVPSTDPGEDGWTSTVDDAFPPEPERWAGFPWHPSMEGRQEWVPESLRAETRSRLNAHRGAFRKAVADAVAAKGTCGVTYEQAQAWRTGCPCTCGECEALSDLLPQP